MPLLLLALCLALIGCSKPSNEIIGTNFDKKEVPSVTANVAVTAEKKTEPEFDKRPQLILNHKNEESTLRNKLIEQLIERELKTNKNTNFDQKDEFNFSENVVRNQLDIQDFQTKSKESARVFVSFAGIVYAYLVPTNIPVEELSEKLEINPEDGRTLLLMSSSNGLTKAGQAIYFLSVNHEDLMAHDRLTYNEQFKVDTKSASHQLKLLYGQTAILKFDVNYFVQTLHAQLFNGQARKCLPDEREAGSCDACTFYREIPSAEFKVFAPNSLNELGLGMSVDGKNYSANDLGMKLSAGSVEVKLDVNNFTKEAETDFRFNFNPGNQSVSTKDYSFTERCQSKSPNARTDLLQTKVLSTYSVKIWGRGSLLKNIKLK